MTLMSCSVFAPMFPNRRRASIESQVRPSTFSLSPSISSTNRLPRIHQMRLVESEEPSGAQILAPQPKAFRVVCDRIRQGNSPEIRNRFSRCFVGNRQLVGMLRLARLAGKEGVVPRGAAREQLTIVGV